ncbi:MAG: pyridoxal phosphate-dependent aminotransferase [Candidatus Omnitrophica bacterium]|nr:pyridoxal phosphate-dependent aminotransferase [Candidatus Omnitrophota bacterium]MDE2215035.1 pyridoxal phosphate-dependent aminotransferase [Candidatus Omnitrophota bacterium]MDE2231735.1 pyridoxal phosphate-dependent aminotransferase [Candidatus Omnitrophota bacterium]
MLRVNRRVKDMLGSTTLAITARAKELQAQGLDVVNFGAGEPDFDTPDFIKQAGIRAIEKGMTKYTPSIGTLELREAIAAKFQKDNALVYKPNQIVVSCGAKHALFNIVQVLVDDGDEVVFQSPYWVSYPEMVKAAGGKSVVIATGAATGFKITPDLLKKHLSPRTKLLIINSPSNPTGVMYTKEELASLAEICVAHKIYVISDEIYEKLIYDTTVFTSIASLGKDIYDLTITVNGVSKAYAMTGWRIGYAAGPQEIMEYIKKYQDHSTSNPASISQAAAVDALKATSESIDKMRQTFKKRRDLMLQCLDKIPLLSYIRPQGAFYVFCDFSKVGDATQVSKRILDEALVAGIPGDGFGAPEYIRFSFATSEARIQEGIGRVAKWIVK